MFRTASLACVLVGSVVWAASPPDKKEKPPVRKPAPPVQWWSAPAESFFEATLAKAIEANPGSADKARAAAAAGAKKVDEYRSKVKADLAALDAERVRLRKSGYDREGWNKWFERNRELYGPVQDIILEFRAAAGFPEPSTADPAADERRVLREKLRKLEESLAALGAPGQDAIRRLREFRQAQAAVADRLGTRLPSLRGPLGAEFGPIEPMLRTKLGADDSVVAVVISVDPGSRAFGIGLKAEDVIVSINGKPFLEQMKQPGLIEDELISLKVLRDGKPLTLNEKE